MNRPKIYVDTSVIGGVFDEEFSKASLLFFKQAKHGYFDLVTSTIIKKEISPAPQEVRDFFNQVQSFTSSVPMSRAAIELRDAYLKAKIVSSKYADDALHVALATVNNCQIIVSWNFKHIVHCDKMSLYNAVNTLQGYQKLAIFSPLEVLKYEQEKI